MEQERLACARFCFLSYFNDATIENHCLPGSAYIPTGWECDTTLSQCQINRELTWSEMLQNVAISSARSSVSIWNFFTSSNLNLPGYNESISMRIIFFVNAEEEKVIITLMGRGSDASLKEIVAAQGIEPYQIPEFVLDKIGEAKRKYPVYKFILTGHAFGGYFARVIYLENYNKMKADGEAFDGIIYKSAYVFDAPGVINGFVVNNDRDDVELYNFVNFPNMINCIGVKHGKIYLCEHNPAGYAALIDNNVQNRWFRLEVFLMFARGLAPVAQHLNVRGFILRMLRTALHQYIDERIQIPDEVFDRVLAEIIDVILNRDQRQQIHHHQEALGLFNPEIGNITEFDEKMRRTRISHNIGNFVDEFLRDSPKVHRIDNVDAEGCISCSDLFSINHFSQKSVHELGQDLDRLRRVSIREAWVAENNQNIDFVEADEEPRAYYCRIM